MAHIIPIGNFQIKYSAIAKIIEMSVAADALDSVPLDVLAAIEVKDTDGELIDSHTALTRVTLCLLGTLSNLETHRLAKIVERNLIEHGRVRP